MRADKPRFLSKKTAELADHISLHFLLAEMLFQQQGIWSNVENMASGAADFQVLTPDIPAESSDEMFTPGYVLHLTEATAVHHNWFNKSGRVAFSFHPDMVENLRGSTSTKLPGSIFRQMAHTSPLILFTRPVPTTTVTGADAQLHGFLVYGIRGDVTTQTWSICETDDDAMTALGLMMLIAGSAEVEELQYDRLVIPLTDTFTVADVVEKTVRGYNMQDGHESVCVDTYRKRIRAATELALNVLLYVCDTGDGDHAAMPPALSAKRKSHLPRFKNGPTRFIASGWVDGPALEQARRRRTTEPAASGGTGREHEFHRRRGHFNLYWTGVGRTIPRIKWLKPHNVREDKAASAPARMIHVPSDGRRKNHQTPPAEQD